MYYRKSLARHANSRGAALIIVLAFVVLLTGLVVAFFSRSIDDRQLSNSSFHQAKVDELARSALDIVTGDLKQEIVNGSSLPDANPNDAPVYVSTSNTYMVPQKNVGESNGVPKTWKSTTAPNTTLIRISSPNSDTPFPFQDHTASNASSTGTSANGRSISLVRWNQHYLVPLVGPGAKDATPDENFNAPYWVYVTGTAGPATPALSAPSSGVIGRYAYAVYDEGALLDANVAGYPSDPDFLITSGSNLSPYQTKGSVAFADLTAFGANAPTQAGVNDLVGWRNYASMQPTGAFPSFGFSSGTLATQFQDFICSNTTGFMTVSGSMVNGQTDQAFLTRQQLINLVLSIGQENFNPINLQYLGTFSRTVSAPSWSPQTPTGSSIQYADLAEQDGQANRDVPNVRFHEKFTVTHYTDGVVSGSGTMISPPTSATYTVNPGDQLMQSRFSLAKIAWLSEADPNTGKAPSGPYAKAIQACFGLTWGRVGAANGGNPCWSYVGSDGGASGTIETLDKVASDGREPNFFEVLKAAILNGSLGLSPGKTSFQNSSWDKSSYHDDNGNYGQGNGGCDNLYSQYLDPASGRVKAPAGVSDMQILQIGANIIDQYDADSYPTAIYLKNYPGIGDSDASSAANQIKGPCNMVYGDENLPYLLGVVAPTVTMDGSLPGSGKCGSPYLDDYSDSPVPLAQWWQPELWNPHQVANASNSSVTPPSNFKIEGFGRIKMYCTGSNGYSTPQKLDNTQWITFSVSSPSALAAQPVLLTTASGTAGIGNVTASMKEMVAVPVMFHESQNPFVGFWSGTDTNYCGAGGGGGTGVGINVSGEADSGPYTFCLGWMSKNGFHPYSYIPGLHACAYGNFNNSGLAPACGSCDPSEVAAEAHFFADPRTIRFGTTYSWAEGRAFTLFEYVEGSGGGPLRKLNLCGDGQPPASNFHYVTEPGSSGILSLSSCLADWEVNQRTPTLPSKAVANYYNDPDGVIRPGDGVAGNPNNGDGMLTYFTQAPGGGSAVGDTGGTGVQHGRRPVILNRPFRSVGELGYTFRDLPFKTLDFFSQLSADAALLDVFSVRDESRVVENQLNSVAAGQVNLSDAPASVIQAILTGARKKDSDTGYTYKAADAESIASQFVQELKPTPDGSGPLANRADLVLRMGVGQSTTTKVPPGVFSKVMNTHDQSNKAYLEAPVRALADVANTRTWNLMIDVIAQTGSFLKNAPLSNAALNSSFVVQGERRYWLHVAIDRVTGKVVDEQLEPVYE